MLKYFFIFFTSFILVIFSNIRTLSAAELRFEGQDLRQGSKYWASNLPNRKGTVLMFISATCPCSQSYFAYLNQMQKQFPQYEFIGIHSNKNLAVSLAQNYLGKYKIEFPVLDDSDLTFANRFQALKTPHIFLLDGNGHTVFQGAATDSRNPDNAHSFYLKDALTSLTNGQEIVIKEAKTLGCYIER